MFKSLSNNLNKIFDKIRSKGVLTEEDLELSLRELRIALLEADVALSVIKDFLTKVKEKAIGQKIIKSISPGDMIVNIVHKELIEFLSSPSELKPNSSTILMAGLQGAGKTTASAKLAKFLSKQSKKVLLVSLDTYRPAAQEQLEILANSIKVDSLPIIKDEKPLKILERAKARAKDYDIIIYDTAGRLNIDETMMDELIQIKNSLKPDEILLVADSMIGQEAVNIAKSFNEKLDITGIILSRIDGDSRGGAALSMKYITGKPIKFLSHGENVDSLDYFNAERIASNILGKGDIVALVERASQAFDLEDTDRIEQLNKKLEKGNFNLEDLRMQLMSMKKMGNLTDIIGMIPGISKLTKQIPGNANEMLNKQIAIINSMTKKERRNPDTLNGSRKRRIAEGSGSSIQEVNKLLKQFTEMQKMIKQFSKNKESFLGRGLSGVKKLFS